MCRVSILVSSLSNNVCVSNFNLIFLCYTAFVLCIRELALNSDSADLQFLRLFVGLTLILFVSSQALIIMLCTGAADMVLKMRDLKKSWYKKTRAKIWVVFFTDLFYCKRIVPLLCKVRHECANPLKAFLV